jgi:hypothetical protein
MNMPDTKAVTLMPPDRLLFANITWMKHYEGITRLDKPQYGGSWIAESGGKGGEVKNFLTRRDGYVYGYVANNDEISLDRIGGPPGSPSLHHVTVVWVSRSERFGTVIVGWYKDATVFRSVQDHDGLSYFMRAKAKNCHLLDVQDRKFEIPRGAGWMGQKNRWYADRSSHAIFRRKVLRYLETNKLPNTRPRSSHAFRKFQIDIKKRLKIERRAMLAASRHYEERGYRVKYVHTQKIGWDLEARRNRELLRIEVKGLSGGSIAVEVTPNEYVQMRRHQKTFHLCVVLDALKRPQVRPFIYSQKRGGWYDDEDLLKCRESIAARLWI